MKIRDLFPNTDIPGILGMYREAFSGYPWYEQLSEEIVRTRWEHNSSQPNFRCLVAENEIGQVVGAVWWNSLNESGLRKERGEQLEEFVASHFPGWSLVWEREVMVSTSHQGKGLGLLLRQEFQARLVREGQKILVLTRMRDDNGAIIHSGEKIGFQRTGIRLPSSQKPGVFHEYWYLPVTVADQIG
ncbi:MAG: GNAT family N-acetyltransferase [Patescibacteria group bacterium]